MQINLSRCCCLCTQLLMPAIATMYLPMKWLGIIIAFNACRYYMDTDWPPTDHARTLIAAVGTSGSACLCIPFFLLHNVISTVGLHTVCTCMWPR